VSNAHGGWLKRRKGVIKMSEEIREKLEFRSKN